MGAAYGLSQPPTRALNEDARAHATQAAFLRTMKRGVKEGRYMDGLSFNSCTDSRV